MGTKVADCVAADHQLSFCAGLLLQMGDVRSYRTNQRRRGWKGGRVESAVCAGTKDSRDAHSASLPALRHLRAGGEPLCRVGGSGSVRALAFKRSAVLVVVDLRERSTHDLNERGGLLWKVCDAREYHAVGVDSCWTLSTLTLGHIPYSFNSSTPRQAHNTPSKTATG